MKTALSILYIFVLTFILCIVSLGYGWVFDNILFPCFWWFFERNVILKIIIILFLGVVLAKLSFGLINNSTALLTLFVMFFPANKFTIGFTYFICFVNLIYQEFVFWELLKADVWFFFFWLFNALLITQLNYLFVAAINYKSKNNLTL